MKGTSVVSWLCLTFCALGSASTAGAVKFFPAAQPVSVVMLSDLHFDPYRDPAKVSALRASPVMQWAKILGDPDSVTQAADYASRADGLPCTRCR